MRTKKRTIGSRLLAALVACAALACADDSYALIFGTVFQPSGHAMPGADVELRPEASGKSQRTRTSPRGEFTFRVAAKPARYTVTVKAKGLKSESKPVQIQGDERADLSFLMEPEK